MDAPPSTPMAPQTPNFVLFLHAYPPRDSSPPPPHNPRYLMSLTEFKKAQNNSSDARVLAEFTHQKTILKLIKRIPYRWAKGSARITKSGHTDVAHRFYKMTGFVVPTNAIASFYADTKNELLRRLEIGISGMKFEPQRLEAFLLTSWPLYKYFQYYRGVTVPFETDLYRNIGNGYTWRVNWKKKKTKEVVGDGALLDPAPNAPEDVKPPVTPNSDLPQPLQWIRQTVIQTTYTLLPTLPPQTPDEPLPISQLFRDLQYKEQFDQNYVNRALNMLEGKNKSVVAEQTLKQFLESVAES